MSLMSRPSCRWRARRPIPLQRRSRDASAASAALRAWRRSSRASASALLSMRPIRSLRVCPRTRSQPAERPTRRSPCSPVRPGHARRVIAGSRSPRWTRPSTPSERSPRTVFLTQGRLQLAAFARAPQHRYIVRTIDRPAEIDALPDCKLILARGPFSLAEELALMQREQIETLVTKNSGGRATYRQDRSGARARNRSRHPAPAARA